jgi:DNA invertase Pin-like site-specific DNA recombinase
MRRKSAEPGLIERALAKAIAMLREGDVLLVTRLDRLARSKDCEITPRTCQRYMKLAGDLMRC